MMTEQESRNINNLSQNEQQACALLVEKILSQAKAKGATAAEVAATVDAGFAVTVRMGAVDTVEFNRDRGFSITVYLGQAKGSASTTDTSDSSISTTVDAALRIARLADTDPCAGLADKADLAFGYPDLQLCHPWDITPEAAISLAEACEERALAYDKRISNSEGASLSTHQGYYVYGNSHGFIGRYPWSRHSINCVLVAQSNAGMERDYYYTSGRDALDLEPLQTVAKKAAARTIARLGARKLATCNVPVLFAPEVARGLIAHFLEAISGTSLYRKASFLLDSVGKPIFPSWLQIIEDPLCIKGNGSAPFDADGLRTQNSPIITDGILQRYLLSLYSARRLGLKPTANGGGVYNILVKTHKPMAHADLLKQMGKGLLVTELMGQGVNTITGDYSRGATGFWVENGEIQYPVHEVTIAGHLETMFKNLVAIGDDVDKRGNIQTGSVLVEEMKVAGL